MTACVLIALGVLLAVAVWLWDAAERRRNVR